MLARVAAIRRQFARYWPGVVYPPKNLLLRMGFYETLYWAEVVFMTLFTAGCLFTGIVILRKVPGKWAKAMGIGLLAFGTYAISELWSFVV